MNVSIRQLTENDWRVLSQIRLKALQTDPKVFGSNYEKESKMTETDWRGWLRREDAAVFMLFADEKPIGMTGVSVWREDLTNQTAILTASWLEPDFRGRGLSKLIYEARIEWAKAHPTIKRIIVSHRASNVASKFANRKHGFVFTHTNKKVWSDGVNEDEVCYELKLNR